MAYNFSSAQHRLSDSGGEAVAIIMLNILVAEMLVSGI